MSDLERGFAMTEKLPATTNTDTTISNTLEAAKSEPYKVQAGDTLSKIAQANNTTVSELAKANDITNINQIKVGQILKMPSSTVRPAAVASAPVNDAPAMPKPKINTAPSTQKTTVASKPVEAPKVEAKSPEDQLAAAGTRLGAAIDVLGKFPENKVAQDMKSEAETTIAKLKAIRDKEEVVRNKEEAAKKYANSSPGNQILFDYQAALKSLIADSIKP